MKSLTFLLSCSMALCCTVPALAQIKPSSVVTGKLIGESRELRNIPLEKAKADNKPNRAFGENDIANKRIKFPVNNPMANSTDPAIQKTFNRSSLNSPGAVDLTFNGNGQPDNAALGFGAYTPPDPTMAVGPNHIVQMMNVAHSVYNKAGTRLAGPLKFSSIAPTATNDGDPIALYDQLADRFLILQFSSVGTGNDALIFCISKTPDPAGAYYVYSFPTVNTFPDYPHVGIWNNSYVISTHEFNIAGTSYLGQGFYAVDRSKMVQGAATSTMIRFNVASEGGYLPACMEGNKTPEANALPMFWGWDADELGAPTDRLLLRTLSLNFTTPGLSTLSTLTTINTAAFDGRSPNAASISQQGTAVALDAIADRMMSRVIYRRFDNYEALVMNHVVNVSGVNPTGITNYQAAMRWYELRRNLPTDPWTIFQQSTYSGGNPTGDGATGMDLWMGATGIDQRGNIAVAYSRSSTTTFPSIYYGERMVTDPLNSLSAEQVFFAGSGSQTSTGNRWGDYSSINTDPADEDSIWYTTEYYPATSSTSFRTRIGKFKINSPVLPEVHFKTGGTICRASEATTLKAGSTCLRYKDYPILLTIDQAPTQPVNLTISKTGTATEGLDYDLIFTNPVILTGASPTASITLRVYDDASNEPNEFIDMSYSLNANGGTGVAATYNQKHRVTIISKTGTNVNDFISTVTGSPVTVFSDNFDAVASGLGNWAEQVVTFAGTTNDNHFIVGTNYGTGFSGKALYVSNNNDTIKYSAVLPASSPNKIIIRAVSPVISTLGKNNVTVSFDFKALGETPSFDYGSLFYSIDNGTTWTNANTSTKLISQATVINKVMVLPANAANISTLKIGFQWESDYSVQNQPPLGVDNVVVTATPASTTAFIQSAVNAGLPSTGSFNFGPNQTVNFVDTATNRIMAVITNTSAFNFGCTKVEVDRAGTGAVAFNTAVPAQMLASKTFKVTPEFNSAVGTYTIRLYYTEAELAGWEAATGQSRTGIKMVKVNGNNSIANVTPANQGSYVYSVNDATLSAFGPDGISLDATLGTGFSGFGIGKPLSVVPVSLLSFRGENIKGVGNKLYWEVSNQVNVKHYELEYSTDGTSFTALGNIAARASNSSSLAYEFVHPNYIKGANFYRLKPVDMDGHFSLSGIVRINITGIEKDILVYPNPVKDKLMINYRGNASRMQVEVTDAAGKRLFSKTADTPGITAINVAKLPAGNYILRVTDAEGTSYFKFVKE